MDTHEIKKKRRMIFLEKKIFGRAKKENKIVEKLARPISLFLTIVFAVGVIVLVMFGVIPQLTRTIGTLMMSIADFIPQMQSWIREFSHNNQEKPTWKWCRKYDEYHNVSSGFHS